jgi:hypothetical protein
MNDRAALALQVFDQLRQGTAWGGLSAPERASLDHHMNRIAKTLGSPQRAPADPYAHLLGTPADLQRQIDQGGAQAGSPTNGQAPAQPPAAPPPAPPATSQIGQRAADALEAVNFPGFVAALLTGTFKAIVDATTQQVREYANLVASLSQSVDDFSRDKVSLNQVRDWLRDRHPQDLEIELPAPGKADQPRLLPRADREGQSPAWLEEYGLGGQALSAELTDGPLLDAGRPKVGEERMQTLATLVLMGVNRVVVNDGDIRARLQFHAAARDLVKADIEQEQLGISGQQVQSQATTSMMVSTLKANAQADSSIKADLMGEVHITFRSETFPLERFADSAAIQLINRHARWQKDAGAPSTAGASSAPTSPTGTQPASARPAPTAEGGK